MFKSFHIPPKTSFIQLLIAVYFVVLLVFGKSFTKLQVAGPLYLHDLMLAIITLLAIALKPRIRIHSPAILLLVLIATVYFIIDLFNLRNDGELLEMAIRQFGIILYLACAMLLFGTQVYSYADCLSAIGLIRFLGNLSILLQCIFLVYGFIFIPGFSLSGRMDYNYFSPLVILGVITYCADVISNKDAPIRKSLKFLFGMGISLTLGHTSAFLGVFIILMLYFYIKVKPIQRTFSFVFIIVAVFALFFLPQFTDINASWRLLYWQHILTRSVTDGYLIWGHGFGTPFMTLDFAHHIEKVLHSGFMIYQPMARYITPPHNSILTIIFHIGLIPAMLFFVPLKNFFRQLFFKRFPQDNNSMFLILSLCGCVIWICFNVILELPHSSVYFWLVYFSAIAYFNKYRQQLSQD